MLFTSYFQCIIELILRYSFLLMYCFILFKKIVMLLSKKNCKGESVKERRTSHCTM